MRPQFAHLAGGGHLDQITQQNATLVEQSAAASEGLKQQAARLVEAVSVLAGRVARLMK
jgi:hypothetical protein